MENFWGTGVTRFVALYAEDRAARLVLWEPDQKAEGILKVGDLQSSQVSAHSSADTGKQKAAAGQPAVSPAAWHEQHAALGSLQQKRAPRDGAGGGCGAGEQPELGKVNTEPRRVEPFCAERPLPSYLLCFRETPKCHFPFCPFLLRVLFLLLSPLLRLLPPRALAAEAVFNPQ